MLQSIRDNSRGIFAKIFIGFVIAIFALFGLESIVGTMFTSNSGITVNGTEITEMQIENTVQRRLQQMFMSMEDDEIANLDESEVRADVIRELIQQEVLAQAAEEAGLVVSARSIDRQIAATEQFQINGQFDNQMAQAMLASAGFTPSSYRAALERDGRLAQFVDAYTSSVFVTPAELELIAALSRQSRDLRFVVLDYRDQASELSITDQDIEAYYQANPAEFMREEQVAVQYLLLDRNLLAEDTEVSEDAIRSRFEEELAELESEVERRASHILFEASGDEAIAEARLRAEAVKARLEEGEDFETLAAEFSDDSGSASFGGDVGFTKGDSFVPPFEEALASLEEGEVSGPVVTQFGVHLIKLTEFYAPDLPEYEDRRSELRDEIALERVNRRYQEMAEELNTLSFESFDLELPAETLGLEIRETELFGRSGGAGLAAQRAFIDAAFSVDVLEDRLNSELVRIDDDRSVVVHLAQHNPAELRPLDEVRPLIEVQLRSAKVAEQAREAGEALVARLEQGEDISEALEAEGRSWTEVNGLQRDSGRFNPEVMDWLFSIAAPESGASSLDSRSLPSGEYLIAEITGVTQGSLADIDEEERRAMEMFVTQQTASDLFDNLLEDLEKRAEIRRR